MDTRQSHIRMFLNHIHGSRAFGREGSQGHLYYCNVLISVGLRTVNTGLTLQIGMDFVHVPIVNCMLFTPRRHQL